MGVALIASLLAETHRNTERRRDPFSVEEFMPFHVALDMQGPQLGEMDDDGFCLVEGGQEMLAGMKQWSKVNPNGV